MNFNGDTLQHNNKFIISNLIKRLIRATFLSTPASDVHER